MGYSVYKVIGSRLPGKVTVQCGFIVINSFILWTRRPTSVYQLFDPSSDSWIVYYCIYCGATVTIHPRSGETVCYSFSTSRHREARSQPRPLGLVIEGRYWPRLILNQCDMLPAVGRCRLGNTAVEGEQSKCLLTG